MLKKYRAELNTINWAVLGLFVLMVSYVVFGSESSAINYVTEVVWSNTLFWLPVVMLLAFLSLYAEIKSGEEGVQSSFAFLTKPALLILICSAFVIVAVLFS